MIWMVFIKILKNTNPKKKRKVLIVVDNMVADMLSNKTVNPIVTTLIIKRKKIKYIFCFD